MTQDSINHVEVTSHVDKECQGPGGLRNLVQVDKGVDEPGSGECPEQVERKSIDRICGDVEGTEDEERSDVFNVVQVTPPNTLNNFCVEVHFGLG